MLEKLKENKITVLVVIAIVIAAVYLLK